jgi:MoxR-like ATPase
MQNHGLRGARQSTVEQLTYQEMEKLYQGDSLTTKKQATVYGIDPYIPSKSLRDAVQLAQILGRPLLVKGEPGCGKSRLAEAVAAEMHGEEFRKYYFEWNVKSTSKAQEGLYLIDHLSRLSEANIKGGERAQLQIELYKNGNRYLPEGNFISLREIGQAFEASNDPKLACGPVILIDEIDKADIDFPNDLLLELDRLEFKIPEIKDQDGEALVIQANKENKPLIIITSNDEKSLPAAFLRRCLFHYISFSDIKLDQIISAKFPDLENGRPELVKSALLAFKQWRARIEFNGSGLKNISTSELLDWFSVLEKKNHTDPINPEVIPPYYETLLKDVESIQIFAPK